MEEGEKERLGIKAFYEEFMKRFFTFLPHDTKSTDMLYACEVVEKAIGIAIDMGVIKEE